ncbi:DUF1428 domain-containing protein [Yoonia sp. 2307UL14-13]|uniref:DUF1428 domain-containing protein n=1 Tax=Yoonia sp. 2307UL14-13 TaxID=3126506 RepID=UPI00309ADDE9
MSYFDGFVIPVPTENKDKFKEYADEIDAIFMEYGATRIVECWPDDVPDGEHTDFRKAVKAKPDESAMFSFIEWPNKATRDVAMGKLHHMMQTDPRFDEKTNPPPFDGLRMIYGGFAPLVDLKKT